MHPILDRISVVSHGEIVREQEVSVLFSKSIEFGEREEKKEDSRQKSL